MSILPPWVRRVKHSVPEWMARIAHPDGPGRYRFAMDAYEPYDLDSSALAQGILFSCGGSADISKADRLAWVDYLCEMQREEDGLLIDAAMERHIVAKHGMITDEDLFNVRRFTTRNALIAVGELGGSPRYALRHQEAFHHPEQVTAYFDSLDWSNPWRAGSWAGAVVQFQHFNRMLDDERANELIQAAVDWLITHQRPENGAWSDGSDVALHVLINGIFKIYIQVLGIADLPVQYPERLVDLCLDGLCHDPALSESADACSVFDVALVLDTALRFTDHRCDEVAERLWRYLPKLEPMVRPDGAFSYSPHGSLAVHGGLALAPVKDQADIAGTAFMVNAVTLIANRCGARDELGWSPLTEWRMKLS